MTTSSISRAVRSERGAIMAEAAICVPFFLLLWLGLLALHSLWSARLTAQVLAHATAYRDTAAGHCQGEASPAAADANSATQGLDANTASALEAGGDDLFDWSPRLIEAVVQARHIPALFEGPTRPVAGRARLLCNTEPKADLGDFIFDIIAGWVG